MIWDSGFQWTSTGVMVKADFKVLNICSQLAGERGKRGFSCDEQKVNGSSSSSQSRAKGSEGRMVERG